MFLTWKNDIVNCYFRRVVVLLNVSWVESRTLMSEDRGFRNALVSRFCKEGHTMHADGAIVIAIRMMMVMTIMVMKAMKMINLLQE